MASGLDLVVAHSEIFNLILHFPHLQNGMIIVSLSQED